MAKRPCKNTKAKTAVDRLKRKWAAATRFFSADPPIDPSIAVIVVPEFPRSSAEQEYLLIVFPSLTWSHDLRVKNQNYYS